MRKKARGSKVLVFGIDGASWNVLEPLMERGVMPNLALMVKKYGKEVLKSTIPAATLPAWMDFATGVNAGKHGAYDLLKFSRQFNQQDFFAAKEVKSKRFYEILDEQGKRCVIVNLPGALPMRLRHGVGVASFINPPSESDWYPENLDEKIKELKDYKVFADWRLELSIKQAWETIIDVEERRFKVGKKLFKGEWDFFFYLISGSDWLMHRLGGDFFSGKREAVELVERFFKRVDEMLGWFWQNGQGVNLVIMSDHGFKHLKGKFFINHWLAEQGWLRRRRIGAESLPKDRLRRVVERRLAGQPVIQKLINWMIKYWPGLLSMVGWGMTKFGWLVPWLQKSGIEDLGVEVDQSRTRVYGRLFFARLGRFESEKEKERFTKDLVRKLKSLRFQGRKVFEEVYRREEVYKGRMVEQIPELVWRLGEVMIEPLLTGSTVFKEVEEAGHSSEGILVMSGPGVKRKKRAADLVDLAPTILRLMGVKIPKEMEGKALVV